MQAGISSSFGYRNPGATEDELESLRVQFDGFLPSAYCRFLREANGAECGPSDQEGDSLRILHSSEVWGWNEGYELWATFPFILAFASDGGCKTFAFDRSADEDPDRWPVVMIDLGDQSHLAIVRASFTEWAEAGYPIPEAVLDERPSAEIESRMKLMALRAAQQDAYEAFLSKDYGAVILLLTPFESDLTELDAAKLNFARKRHQRSQ